MTKLISVHSYRGGTGKSNIVANLAVVLAQQGKRVAVIDGDIQSPGIHVILGLEEKRIKYTLNDYLWSRCLSRDAVYDLSSKLVKGEGEIKGQLFLIPSSASASDVGAILKDGYDMELLSQAFFEFSKELSLDYLMLDTHPGLSEETLLAIGLSSLTLIVLRPDYQDYQGTAVFVEVARELGVSRMKLVINQVLDSVGYFTLQEQIEEAYHVPVAGILPISTEMIRLGSQNIFCQKYPETEWADAIVDIAKSIQKSLEESFLD